MADPLNRCELPALRLTLATVLCLTAMADVSSTVVVPLQGDGATLSEHRRNLAERIAHHFQQWQVAQAAVLTAKRCAVDTPRESAVADSAPVTQSLSPAARMRPHLLNLPPPSATI